MHIHFPCPQPYRGIFFKSTITQEMGSMHSEAARPAYDIEMPLFDQVQLRFEWSLSTEGLSNDRNSPCWGIR